MRGNRIVKIIMLPLTLIKNVGDKLGVEIFPAQNNEDKGENQILFRLGYI